MKVIYIVVRHLAIFAMLRKFFKDERGKLTQQSLASLHTILHVVRRPVSFYLLRLQRRNSCCVSLMSTRRGDLL